jgi:RNA polymerase sigma factor (sigma-70 family)
MNGYTDFNGFLKRLSPKLKGIAFKLNRGLVSMDEQDLFQEAVVFLWEHFQKGDFSDKTESYILQGCYFYLQNFIRMSKDRINRVAIDDGAGDESIHEERVVLVDGNREDFLKALDTKLLVEIISNNGLTGREKSLLPLFAQGLTTREIGSRIGVSHVAIVKMKKTIGDKCRKYLDLHVK